MSVILAANSFMQLDIVRVHSATIFHLKGYISSVKQVNSSGPQILPFGTPESTEVHGVLLPLMTTR